MPTMDDGVPVYGAGEAADLTVITAGIADALRGRKNRRCSSIADMYSKINALESGDRPGSLWFVDGKGWYGHDGTNPWKLPQPGLDYVLGHWLGVPDSNGLFSITHNLGTGLVAVSLTPMYVGTDDVAARTVLYKLKVSIRSFSTNSIQLIAQDSTTGGAMVASIGVAYRIEKFPTVP